MLIKNKKLVYTVIFDDYDKLLEIDERFINESIDYICITDNYSLTSSSWNVQYVRKDIGHDSVVLNRKYKMMPHLFFPHEQSIYIDGNIKIEGDLNYLFEKYLTRNQLAIPFHSERNCIYDEAEACCLVGKVKAFDIEEYLFLLKRDGFPEKFGLFENNVILRANSEKINLVMEKWFDYFIEGVKRDQLILCYLLWKYNVKCISVDEGPRYSQQFLKICLHKKELSLSLIKKLILISKMRKNVNIYYRLINLFFDKALRSN